MLSPIYREIQNHQAVDRYRGINNVNNDKYWIFHPFPQRTFFAQLKFNY